MAAIQNLYDKKNYIPIPIDELHKRRAARDRKERISAITSVITRKAGKWGVTGAGIAIAWVGGNYLLNKSNHVKSDDTLAALKADLGQVPKGVISISPTGDPNVRNVHYVVQSRPEDKFVSSIAADLHPIAPNQDPQSEFSAINTYLRVPDKPIAGQDLDILVDTKSGQILDNPASSANHNG